MYLMKFVLLFILFTEIFSSNPIKPNLCVNCKFFTKDFFTMNKFGKCAVFPKEDQDDDNRYLLVDGTKTNDKREYNFCSIARKYERMCGQEGTFYEKK
jgi:hypothetical protein